MKSSKTSDMKRIRIFFILAPIFMLELCFFMLGSCIYDSEIEEIQNGNVLRLSVAVKQPGIQTAMRATVPSELGEDDITALYLLFFQPGGGLFVDYVKIENLIPYSSMAIDMSSHPSLGVSEAYDILAVANIGDDHYITGNVDTWMQQWSGHDMDEVKEQAIVWLQGGEDDSNAISPDRLLMTGSIAKAQDQFDLNLELTRNMIRFDVYNNQRQQYDLVSTEIWNAYPTGVIWKSGTATIDFSGDVARTGRFYGVDNSGNITGMDGSDGRGSILGNIAGGLYCFENQVIAPSQNDRLTTCLIVGLKERATGTTSYYRVNINPAKSAQILSANNVYRLTIRGVIAGSATVEDAYNAAESGLDYVINYWDMSDYGLIVQDGNSILSIPTKTIVIDEEGGDPEFQIFTFNNSGTDSKLTIKAQNYDPSDGSISATLTDNTLSVHAIPLNEDEMQRTGAIELSYAGLKATVYVVQNRGEGAYLRIHLPVEKIRSLAPYAGMATGDLRVEASGPWTAQLYMPDDGFTFDPEQVYPNTATTTILSSNELVVDNRFKVYTWSANDAPTSRNCFVLVTLDSDPENYAAVVQLAQSPAGGISLVPNISSVTFNGMGTGLAVIAGNTTATFNVHPSMEEDSNGGEQIAKWEYEILPVSVNNDDSDMFTITGENHDPNDNAANTITVGAIGQNLSGRPYTAILRLYLTLDHSTYTDLKLVQQPLNISLSPGILPAVGITGGLSGAISVVADASLKWTAKLVDTSGASSDNRSLVHHEITLEDQNGNLIVEGVEYPMTTKMRVRFPKVYYPNRDIPISATITVSVEGMTSTITVNQTALTARRMVGYGMTGSPAYGGLGNTYNRGWDGTSGEYGLAQIPGYSRLAVDNMNVGSIPGSVNYLHVTPHISGTNGTNYNWSVINDFIANRDGWTVISSQDNNGLFPMNNAQSPTKRNGYNNSVYGSSNSWSQVFQDRDVPSKIYRFVTDQGHRSINPASINSAGFFNDIISNTIPKPWPSTAVVLMTKIDDTTQASLIVDIKNKFMWIGESQIFWHNDYLTNSRGIFLDNLMYFIGNASKYGSHFTDLLLEDDQPEAQPAPWDTYWGNNAGVPDK